MDFDHSKTVYTNKVDLSPLDESAPNANASLFTESVACINAHALYKKVLKTVVRAFVTAAPTVYQYQFGENTFELLEIADVVTTFCAAAKKSNLPNPSLAAPKEPATNFAHNTTAATPPAAGVGPVPPTAALGLTFSFGTASDLAPKRRGWSDFEEMHSVASWRQQLPSYRGPNEPDGDPHTSPKVMKAYMEQFRRHLAAAPTQVAPALAAGPPPSAPLPTIPEGGVAPAPRSDSASTRMCEETGKTMDELCVAAGILTVHLPTAKVEAAKEGDPTKTNDKSKQGGFCRSTKCGGLEAPTHEASASPKVHTPNVLSVTTNLSIKVDNPINNISTYSTSNHQPKSHNITEDKIILTGKSPIPIFPLEAVVRSVGCEEVGGEGSPLVERAFSGEARTPASLSTERNKH